MATWTSGSGRLRAWDLDPNNSELESNTSLSGIITAISSTSVTVEDGTKLIVEGIYSLTGASFQDFLGDNIDNLNDFPGLSGIVNSLTAYRSTTSSETELLITNIDVDVRKFNDYANSDFIRGILSGNDIINGNAYYNDQDTHPNGKWQFDGAGNSFNGNRLHGFDGNDILNGNRYVDSLWGDTGNDTLYGFDGNDFLYGGPGNDSFEGGTGNDKLYGNTGNDILKGGDGDDILIAGSGTDTVDGGAGSDTADYSEFTKSLSVTLNGSTYSDLKFGAIKTDRLKNIENIIGGSGSDTIIGDSNSNIINGGAGNDTLDGGAGNDTLIGGDGNDVYMVENSGDVVTESNVSLSQIDEVRSSVSWSLGANLEKLTLTGTTAINGTGNDLANTITGNSAANTLNGEAGNDILFGGAGSDIIFAGDGDDWLFGYEEYSDSQLSSQEFTAKLTAEKNNSIDKLYGGKGNDFYIFDYYLNTPEIIENANEGIDTILGDLASYTLESNVENYVNDRSFASSTVTITGNNLNNIIKTSPSGWDSADEILNTISSHAKQEAFYGLAGDDTLMGGAGNDILDGGTGVDVMWGGAGNDVYYVDSASDQTNEAISTTNTADATGTDLVYSSVTRTLGNYLENLTLTGTTAINGTGNALANTLTGNSAANTLDGSSGADTLIGGDGNDIYVVDNAAEVVTETNASLTQIDEVRSSVTWTIGANLENLTLTGTTAINGTGNALANTITGNAAANTLKGEAGSDILYGGIGSDSLYGGAGDKVKDVFDFNAITESKTGTTRDKVYDFVTKIDKIDLSGIDANTAAANTDDQAFLFSGTTAKANSVWYKKVDVDGSSATKDIVIYGDVDGNTTADFEIGLVGVTSINATDFVL